LCPTVPFLSLTPIFLIVVPYLVIGETISLPGVIGVLLIAIGGYTLNIKETKKGFFALFAAIMRERGSLYMIVVALIYSITATLGKLAIQHSSPLFFGIIYYSVLAVAMAPIALFKNREEITDSYFSRRHTSKKGLQAPSLWSSASRSSPYFTENQYTSSFQVY
jgi:uncharacterized membrane protein